jgi:hypothetical protein
MNCFPSLCNATPNGLLSVVKKQAFGNVFCVSVFGVLRPYFSVENNQGITMDAECHCPLLQALLVIEL